MRHPAISECLEARRLLAAQVVISEFLASNSTSIKDSFGNHEDWIELHNAGDAAANLNDYFLADSAGNPELWRFPNQQLGPGGYLVIFASGKDLVTAGGEIHTNFKLGAGGEYLGLIRAADDTPVFEYAPSFPAQTTDVSYGLGDADNPVSARMFFSAPTPGAANVPTAQTPVFSQAGRTFSGSIQVSITSPTPGAEIRYTTDRLLPTSSSTLYTGPITLSATTIIRAQAFAAGLAGSVVVSQSYVAVDSTVSGFNSNLPIVVVDTFGATINDTTLIPAAATFIDTSVVDGRTDMLDTPDFDGRIGIRIRGSTSENYPKKGFAVETWDESNDDKKVSLLGMPADSDWVLYDPYSEKSLMQNQLAMKWANETGHYASRTRYVELYLNTTGGSAINYSSSYWGIYILMEKIKAGPDRVNIQKMTTADNTGDAVTGGYIFKKDRVEAIEKSFTTTSQAQKYAMVEPDENSITSQQLSYITQYMNDFETALYGPNFADPVNGYAKYIDVNSFIDFWLVNEMTRNVDSFWLSTFYYKDRDGKVAMGPDWDFNLSMGNANYRDGADSAGWNHDSLTTGVGGQYAYFPRLFQDPNFTQKLTDRWEQLRATSFTTPQMMADIDSDVALLSDNNGNYPVGTNPPQTPDNPVVRNFQKWPELGTFISGNSFYDPQGRWIEDVKLMKNWLTARLNWMDSQFIPQPTLTPGGSFGGPTQVTIALHAQATTTDTTLIGPSAPVRWVVPSGPMPGWQNLGYTYPASPVWATATTGIGYDTQTSPVNFLPFIGPGGNVQSAMLNVNPTVYARIEFNIADPSSIGALILKMKYDDGFVAWINGVRVMDAASAENSNPAWNAAASGSRSDPAAIQDVEFNVSSVKNELVAGTNVLAIQGLNSGSGSADLLIAPTLYSRQYSSAATGAIYYTTDGSDPRASGGAIAPGALLYNGALTLSASTRIRARTLIGSVWSGIADETYVFGASPLRITELMYNPTPTQDYEYIEIKNTNTATLNLSGYHFTNGVTFTFPNIALAAGAYGVIAKDQQAFQSRYGTGVNLLGVYTGSLDNGGETLTIQDGFNQVAQTFTYDDAWYPQTDGDGYALVIRDALSDKTAWDAASGWRTGYFTGGSPGSDDPLPTMSSANARAVVVQYPASVVAPAPGDLQITPLPSGSAITPAGVTYNSVSHTATFTLPAGIADANYHATLLINGVSFGMDMFVLTGDANYDRVVNTLDFNALAIHFNATNASFSQGDLNGDGTVNALDFNLLASQFGATLPPAAASPMAAISPNAATLTELFSHRPVSFDLAADILARPGTQV